MDVNVTDKKSLTYDKELICPVCGVKFSVPVVKSHTARIKKKHTDFYLEYEIINPYFYDIWLCPHCGYAALKKDFDSIKSSDIKAVQEKIKNNWVPREYPEQYDVDTAIERYKVALMNYMVINSKDSQKGYVCLKLSWMYRLKGNIEDEKNFSKMALGCFENAFLKESFPVYGMDIYAVQYLIGELYRRCGKLEEALKWLGQVIVSKDADGIIKEKARDLKDLIKREIQ